MSFLEEPVDDRFKIRLSYGDGSHSVLSHGYAIKLTLIDEKNLLLYRNILESSYSSLKRSVKEESSGKPEKIQWKNVQSEKPVWSENTLQLLSRNFVDESCRLIGEDYRAKMKKTVRRIMRKKDEIFQSQAKKRD